MTGWALAFVIVAAFAGFYYLGYLAGRDAEHEEWMKAVQGELQRLDE